MKRIIVTEGQLRTILREMAFQGRAVGNTVTLLQKFQNLIYLTTTVFLPHDLPFWNTSALRNYSVQLNKLVKQAKEENRDNAWRNRNINPLLKEIIYDSDCFINRGAQNFALKRMGWPTARDNGEMQVYDNAVIKYDERYKDNRELGADISQKNQDENKVGAKTNMLIKLRDLLEQNPTYKYRYLNFFRVWKDGSFPNGVELHEKEGITNMRLEDFMKDECTDENLLQEYAVFEKVCEKCQQYYFAYDGETIITFRRASAIKGKKTDYEVLEPAINYLESAIGRNTVDRDSLRKVKRVNEDSYVIMNINNNLINII